MDICGEGRAPTRLHLLQLAKDSGVPEKDALFCIAMLLQVVKVAPELLAHTVIRKKTAQILMARMNENAARLR